jgi:gentisate 1,2-dioxygenase
MTKPVNDSERRFGIGQLRPTWEHPAGPSSPLLNYKWERTEEALGRLATSDASPFDDVALEYINPHTGGPVLPTMACWIQLIRPGVRTRAHRQTNSAVYHVFRGNGYSVINGERFTWKTGDFFVVPPWVWHEHANDARQEAILFSVQDTPILQALGLYREQAYEANGGHQPITREFRPSIP